jgi:hypothetical protein
VQRSSTARRRGPGAGPRHPAGLAAAKAAARPAFAPFGAPLARPAVAAAANRFRCVRQPGMNPF